MCHIIVFNIHAYLSLGRIDWTWLAYTLATVSAFSVFLPLAVGLFRLRQLGLHLKILLVFLGISAIVESVTVAMASSGTSNVFLIPLFALIELTFVTIVYSKVYQNRIWKRILIFVPIAFTIFLVLNVFFAEGAKNLSSYIRSVEGLLVIGITLVWFYQALNNVSINAIHREPMFWISSGFLIYFAGTFFLFITSTYLLEHTEGILAVAFLINSISNICKNILFTFALWMRPQT